MAGIVYLWLRKKTRILCMPDGEPIRFVSSANGIMWFRACPHLFRRGEDEQAIEEIIREEDVLGRDTRRLGDDPMVSVVSWESLSMRENCAPPEHLLAKTYAGPFGRLRLGYEVLFGAL